MGSGLYSLSLAHLRWDGRQGPENDKIGNDFDDALLLIVHWWWSLSHICEYSLVWCHSRCHYTPEQVRHLSQLPTALGEFTVYGCFLSGDSSFYFLSEYLNQLRSIINSDLFHLTTECLVIVAQCCRLISVHCKGNSFPIAPIPVFWRHMTAHDHDVRVLLFWSKTEPDHRSVV